ncbi:hypothetical protein [Aliivibrio sp. S10_S31]|uniref:hypothetical protein n=1 Tax=Aliivibrio sp. S10_S31 TaxID=2720224 RepID=UPI001680C222|nr:hypothetical protein [Aliivibrio sp. S10_S31]MBD1571501.1 hypothetical protein [Aliivibrio sp. S10_S31]
MIDINKQYRNSVIYSLAVSFAISIFLFITKDIISINLTGVMRVVVTLISALVVGVFYKKHLDLKEKITTFTLPEKTPTNIKQNTKNLISSFNLEYLNVKVMLKFGVTLAVFMLLSFASFPIGNEAIEFVLQHFFIFLLIIFLVKLTFFLNELNSILQNFIQFLEKKESIEEKRQELIEKIQSTKTEFEKNNEMTAKNKDFDVRKLISEIKKDS